jgi:iron complex outermembrane receptor protein
MKKKLKWDIDFSTFYGNVDNWILWQPSDKAYWEAQNIKSVEHSGGEASIGLRKKIGSWKVNFKGSYQYINAINKGVEDESLNKQLIYTPKHSANWLLGVRYDRFWVNTNYTLTGKRYITTSNTSYLPAYDLVNVSLGYRYIINRNTAIDIQIDVENIFNKEYMSVAYRAMPGTTYLISVKYGLNSIKAKPKN